ncbi:transcriptional regulator, GntR family [Litoreibacter ascidiaceicola]|uniref:Transcriptional regulator, GntR family n=1 Tax=Litoreibacter ascidiaceicola TaxID=1486859 RepID=A0A1M4V3Z7_9RHOB|nr:GntR family transcriptional regulator [Litoreibacter ascidiaceicola]SHE63714.1 transcriptional regulator, GntR family [Litoreibacter ascidiaceicola]
MGQSQTEQALSRLREMVFSGELAAGSNHFEADLADRLGMSRTPVREAALTMKAQGLVDVQPRRGVRICPISAEDMADIYDVLCELESLAAARAAERGYTADDLQIAQNCIDTMDAALTDNDRTAWAEADDRFHTELVRLGGNARVIEIVARYTDQVRRARMMTLPLRPLPVKSNADHRAVLDAIQIGDAARARDLHRAHRYAARTLLTGLIRDLGLHRL